MQISFFERAVLSTPLISSLKFPQDYIAFLLVFLAFDILITLFFLRHKRRKRREMRKNHKHCRDAVDSDERQKEQGSLHVDDTFEMTGSQFEDFVVGLYARLGYKIVSAKKSCDQGIDIIIRRVFKTGLQCKCYQKPVGNKAVQEAAAGKKFYRLRKVAVVTNSIFTLSAKKLAKKTGVTLIDRTTLARLTQKANARMR